MPVYKLSKNVQAITTKLKNVDKRYWENLVYKSYLPVGTNVWSTKIGEVMAGDVKSVGKPMGDFILYTGVTYNTSNVIALTTPMEKIKNGLQFNFGSVSVQGTSSPFLPLVYTPYGGSYCYNVAMIKGSSLMMNGAREYEFPIFSSISAY